MNGGGVNSPLPILSPITKSQKNEICTHRQSRLHNKPRNGFRFCKRN
jgi:hypothetical protein